MFMMLPLSLVSGPGILRGEDPWGVFVGDDWHTQIPETVGYLYFPLGAARIKGITPLPDHVHFPGDWI
jgi:hypothetical protein